MANAESVERPQALGAAARAAADEGADGAWSPGEPSDQRAATASARGGGAWGGLAVIAAVAAASYLIHYIPFEPFRVVTEGGVRRPVSETIIAILLGLAVRNTLPLPRSLGGVSKRAIRVVLPAAIVLTGAGLNLTTLAEVGVTVLAITGACIGVAMAGAVLIGRVAGLDRRTSVLIGAGTGICGSSAIVAVAPLVGARDEDLALSIGTVNLCGLVAMLALPAIGAAAGMSSDAYAVWAGTSIHAVPQAVAAGFAFGAAAGALATLVKLVRVAMLAPLVFALALPRLMARGAGGDAAGPEGAAARVRYGSLVPWFLWGFIAMALLNTLGWLPTIELGAGGVEGGTAVNLSKALTRLGGVCLTLAMAAIGLELNLRHLARVGGPALLTGIGASVVLAAGSLGLVLLLM